MRRFSFPTLALTILFTGALAACTAFPGPPPSETGYPPANPPAGPGAYPNGVQPAPESHFSPRQREFVHNYYAGQHGAAGCPPGLAKKHNGCMPPGQAKKWEMGQPLPGDVVAYPIPQPVLNGMGPPPAGYRYVRVANDILLVMVGTQIVVDAIRDLGGQ